MDKGAHFFRSDFQVHSPRDRNWKGCKPTSHEDRMEFARQFVQACREQGLQAVGITDHHDICFVKYFQLAAQERENATCSPSFEDFVIDPTRQKPVIFPGVEVSLSLPCQVIVLLDAEADPTMQAKLLQAIGIGNVSPDCNATAPEPKSVGQDLPGLDKRIREYANGCLDGRFIILPHVSDHGHRTLLRRNFQAHFAKMPCVGGYIEHDWRDHRGKPKLDGSTREYGHKSIGIFQTSDSRSDDFQELGCRTTWVKMAEPTAEAIRQACLAKESRISQCEPLVPTTYISRIEVTTSKFMGGFDLEFNPQFNAIIGGRGTGKSTVLEHLRYAMQDQPVEYDSDIESTDGVARKRRLIQETLEKAKGRVTVHWVLDGTPHVVSYDSGSKEIYLQVGQNDRVLTTAENVRNLLPIRAYSQKPLSSVSGRTNELQRFVEQPIRDKLATFEDRIEGHRAQIRDTYSKILARKQLERNLASAKTELASLTARANAIQETLPKLTDEANDAINEHAPRLREKQAEDALRKDLEAASEALSKAESALLKLPHELDLQEGSPQAQLLSTIHRTASAVSSKVA
jgi:type III restriction enzyme